MEFVIIIIFLILLISFSLSIIFEKIGIPKVLAPIIFGIFFQSFFSDYFIGNSLDVLNFFASFGAIMLLFYIGLQIDIDKFIKKSSETLRISNYTFFIIIIISFLISYFLFHFSFLSSFLISAVLSLTAEGIAAMVLKENKLLDSNIGSIIIGSGIINDITGIFLILILSITISYQTFSYLFIIPVLLGISIILVLFYFIKHTSKVIDSVLIKRRFLTNQIDLLTISIIFLLGFAIFTNLSHLDFSLGAILSGLIINFSLTRRRKVGLREEEEITNIISNITFGFLMYFFLFWVGLQFDFTKISENFLIGIVFSIIVIFGNLIGTFFATRNSRHNLKNKLLISTGLSSKGGIELVIATIGLKSGIIDIDIFSSIILMSIILTFLSPILFNYLIRRFDVKS